MENAPTGIRSRRGTSAYSIRTGLSDHFVEKKPLVLANIGHNFEKLIRWDLFDHLMLLVQDLGDDAVSGRIDTDLGAFPFCERLGRGHVRRQPCWFLTRLSALTNVFCRVLTW